MLIAPSCNPGTAKQGAQAAQHADEALKAAAQGRRLARQGQLGQADDLLAAARRAAAEAQAEAQAAKAEDALAQARRADQYVDDLERELASARAAEQSVQAAKRVTQQESAQFADEAGGDEQAAFEIAKDVVCDYNEFAQEEAEKPAAERRQLTWEDVAGFIRDAAVKQLLPSESIRSLVEQKERFDNIVKLVRQQVQGPANQPSYFELRYCT
jgi:hypothetical protein